ncbi:MAG: hypothetical protein JO293_01450 [Candidatus Eremiobacteraeota bacterium]|nr:hypothetical protein [Candidatus Eremiobacteraeota bacterium]
MRRLALTSIALALAVMPGFGCSSSSTTPTPTPAPQAVYVSSFNTPGKIGKAALPATAASTVTYLTPTALNGSVQLRFDASGNLWSMNDTNTTGQVTGYAPPITNASTPFATITIAGSQFPVGLAFDKSGNMWVADSGTSKVYEFTPPFSGAISPAPAITISSVINPAGLVFDTAGNLYVCAGGGVQAGTVQIFNPPFHSGQSPTATPITGLHIPTSLAFDAAGNLYVTNFMGSVARFNAPTAGGGAVSITDTSTGINSPQDLAFDNLGNLYVTDLAHATVSVFPLATTAFSATLAPSVVLTLSGFATPNAGGIAIGAP